jgi:hypothetical protein
MLFGGILLLGVLRRRSGLAISDWRPSTAALPPDEPDSGTPVVGGSVWIHAPSRNNIHIRSEAVHD